MNEIRFETGLDIRIDVKDAEDAKIVMNDLLENMNTFFKNLNFSTIASDDRGGVITMAQMDGTYISFNCVNCGENHIRAAVVVNDTIHCSLCAEDLEEEQE